MPASTSFSAERRRAAFALSLAALLLLAAFPVAGSRAEKDPFYESFFEKARLIMTNEEEQIYKHLPDAEAKAEFIDEFWAKRDPEPDTAENENKVEFERRIAYANRWFKENRAPGRGWDTQRGRILIQLGEPDQRTLNDMLSDSRFKAVERWVYYYYQLELIFVDSSGFGEFRLYNWPAELLTAIDNAKFALSPASTEKGKALLFDTRYKNGEVVVTIPLKRVRFSEENGSIRASYKVSVTAYRNFIKVDSQNFSKDLTFPKDNVPAGKELGFSLPFPLQGKGKYFIEVLLEDVLTGSRALDYVDFKL
jgi:GWxTD domain-containing protein